MLKIFKNFYFVLYLTRYDSAEYSIIQKSKTFLKKYFKSMTEPQNPN